ncbi:hypothetical protein [Avibacterium sp. 21-599]|uniref:hypothetical protein n=1 Tax=Avibacterium sp. 21-599 TaxID=2911528 RepID=UPI002248143B|nr:hypothetical protein [Avibacterium sp. 21-599]MCW9718486.1 hypothetical protein [Avibacterium sp. 21-599]
MLVFSFYSPIVLLAVKKRADYIKRGKIAIPIIRKGVFTIKKIYSMGIDSQVILIKNEDKKQPISGL